MGVQRFRIPDVATDGVADAVVSFKGSPTLCELKLWKCLSILLLHGRQKF